MTHDGPFLLLWRIGSGKGLSDGLAVLDDAIGAEGLEIARLNRIISPQAQRAVRDGGAEACAALVKTEDLVAAVQHRVGPWEVLRRAALKARAALEIDEPRQLLLGVGLGGIGGLFGLAGTAGKELDVSRGRAGVVARDLEQMLCDAQLA